MALSPGARIGPYEVLAALGAGGMGEVYKARDTRLDRTVALKILPEALAGDPQFRERFDREARAISQLEHPNICALYDVGETVISHQSAVGSPQSSVPDDESSATGRVQYLVMQYLEGETLADRIAKGPLPLDQALKVATEIADALDKAHRAGIVHRDLKPGNVMLTKTGAGSASSPQAKLLDFGLAKTNAAAASSSGLSMLPTTPPQLTMQGAILGTFQYMAPEQIEGEDADARTDIFAFGVVLYEMLTGRKAFAGRTQASIFGAILKDQLPPISASVPAAPPALDRVVARCLAKNPDERWQSAADLRWELTSISESRERRPDQRRTTGRRGVWIGVGAAILAVALVAIALSGLNTPRADAPIIRLQVTTPSIAGFIFAGRVAISADGRSVAFTAGAAGGGATMSLYVRSLDSYTTREVVRGQLMSEAAWSPDGRRILFPADLKLQALDVSSGVVDTVAAIPGTQTQRAGLAWSPTGDIVIGSAPAANPALELVEHGSGSARKIVASTMSSMLFPFFADSGRIIGYLEDGGQSRRVCTVDLGGRPLGCSPISATTIAYAETGYLVFGREATIWAQRFDAKRAALLGEPVIVAEGVAADGIGRLRFAVSSASSGTPVLAYFAGGGQANNQFTWFDRSGKRIANAGEAQPYNAFDLSPDGRLIVTNRPDATFNSSGAWIIDIARGVTTRATQSGVRVGDVVWSPDARQFAYLNTLTGEIDAQPAFGGSPKTIYRPDVGQRLLGVENWSRDGRYVTLSIADGDRRRILAQPVDGGKPIVCLEGRALFDEQQFSPDGKWLSYNSDESGRHEIYVEPFPPTGERWPVSAAGGVQARWRGDSREIFYLTLDGTMMSASFGPGPVPQIGKPTELFKTLITPTYNLDHFGVSLDGQRFLMRIPATGRDESVLNIVVNWTSALKK